MKNNMSFLVPNNNENLFDHIERNQNLKIYGGVTSYTGDMNGDSLTLRNVKELKQIEKHENYIDIGAAVTISELLAKGKNNLPEILYDASLSIANERIRNVATVGGNVFNKRGSLYAALLALDVKLEIKTRKKNSSLFNIQRKEIRDFSQVPDKSVLTKIRVPLKDWEISCYKRIGPQGIITNQNASFAFLADLEKNRIIDCRIAFSHSKAFRAIELETELSNQKLPLDEKAIRTIKNILDSKKSENLSQYFTEEDVLIKEQFLNLLWYNIASLT